MKTQVFRRVTLRGWRWYWRFVHDNGNSMAIGGEAYNSRDDCEAGLCTVMRELPVARVELMDDYSSRPVRLLQGAKTPYDYAQELARLEGLGPV